MFESALIIRLVLATLLGACLGLERSISGKHAGMRTYALVSLGSALFTIVGTLASLQLSFFAGLNPLIIASNVVLGVGFIGAGLAVFRGEHPVELTTASGIWLVAGIGMACGFGLYTLATASMALGIVVFWVLAKLEKRINKHLGTRHEG